MLHIGVLIVPPIQLLDIAPVDLFAMMAESYFRSCNVPQPLLNTAIPDSELRITYISYAGKNSIASTTASLGLAINAGLDDPEVAPGKLDILVIPGPPPEKRPKDEVLDYVRRQVDAGVDLLTICSGVFVAAFAGVLDGKHATGTRGVQDVLEKSFKSVKWEDKRYFHDGRIWSSGGITNGMDMVAAYMRKRWPGALSETVLNMAEVADRGQEYDTGKIRFNAWWVFHIVKTWFGGLLTKAKKS